jgi:restriction endonuclease
VSSSGGQFLFYFYICNNLKPMFAIHNGQQTTIHVVRRHYKTQYSIQYKAKYLINCSHANMSSISSNKRPSLINAPLKPL